MSEVSFSFVWDREREDENTMESCYKLYTWINHTVLMLLFQIFWKVSQISDYFNGKSIEDAKGEKPGSCIPLTRESKYRRHIRSMSDVQCSTPYRLPFRSKMFSHNTLMYDSDTRARRIRSYNIQKQSDSSDSSEFESSMKQRSLIGQNILKHTDSMRIL